MPGDALHEYDVHNPKLPQKPQPHVSSHERPSQAVPVPSGSWSATQSEHAPGDVAAGAAVGVDVGAEVGGVDGGAGRDGGGGGGDGAGSSTYVSKPVSLTQRPTSTPPRR